MKIGFLILAHQLPALLIKQVDLLLDYPDSHVFIHIDLKSIEMYNQIEKHYWGNKRVLLVDKRYKVSWGSFYQIKATFSLIENANAYKLDYYCLLSGQDLPVKPVSEFAEFLSAHNGKEFLVNFKLPDKQWEGGGLKRMELFHFNVGIDYISNKLNRMSSILQNLAGYRRAIKHNLFGGSNWFILSGKAIEYLVKYVHSHPPYLDRFKFTRCADEIFVQTIIMNSPFKDKVISDDLRIIDWSTGPDYPRTFQSEDLDRLISAGGKYFARKFNSAKHPEIINKIYDRIKQ